MVQCYSYQVFDEASDDAVDARARLLERLLLESYLANGAFGPEALKKQVTAWNTSMAAGQPDDPDFIPTDRLTGEDPAGYLARICEAFAARLAPRKWTEYGHVVSGVPRLN